ncbi:10526_t:CDS:2, partial [Racocetra persica]
FSTGLHEFLEEFVSSLVTSVKVTRTPSPENCTRLITDSGTTSVSRIPLTTQQPNANEVQDISSDYTNEASETPKAKTRSNDLVNETTEASNIKNNAKRRPSKVSNKAKTKELAKAGNRVINEKVYCPKDIYSLPRYECFQSPQLCEYPDLLDM